MRSELVSLMVFLASLILIGDGGPAAAVAGPGTNEIYLAFALVFTFAVGLEVVK